MFHTVMVLMTTYPLSTGVGYVRPSPNNKDHGTGLLTSGSHKVSVWSIPGKFLPSTRTQKQTFKRQPWETTVVFSSFQILVLNVYVQSSNLLLGFSTITSGKTSLHRSGTRTVSPVTIHFFFRSVFGEAYIFN